MKEFSTEFEKLKNKIEERENFTFIRFSDGELFVLQNKRLQLGPNFATVGSDTWQSLYTPEEQKDFIPGDHEFFRKKLIDSLQYVSENFYQGIPTRSDVDDDTFTEILNMANANEADERLTFANLLINGNYERYLNEIVPLFSEREIVMVVNDCAKVEMLPFNVKKTFRIGTNCFINDYDIIDEIEEYIKNESIKNHIFLISAASLTNLIGHRLNSLCNENSYIDIGSSLNPMMDMEGWKENRSYLKEYWLGDERQILDKKNIW